MILRSAPQGDGVARHVGALNALAAESFAPDFYGDMETGGKRHLIAMQDVGGRTLTAKDVEQRTAELVTIVRNVHENEKFQECVDEVGMDERARDEPPEWFSTSLELVRAKAPGDERLTRVERWLESARKQPSASDLINSVRVHGHGDLHRDNWLLTPRGVALIDWEDVGPMPLANELASLIVFGHLAPGRVAELYGVAAEYVEAVERSTAQHALYLYVYWLRRLLEEESVDPSDLAYGEAMCERAYG